MTKKIEDGLLQQNHPQEKESDNSIPSTAEKVKPSNPLRDLRLQSGVSVKDMVEVVQTIYPKYDKTLQSKCENGADYGVELKADAMEALRDAFLPSSEGSAPVKKENRRLTCRIYGRLTDKAYEQLQQAMEIDGYATTQDWMTAVVGWYLRTKEASPDFRLERSQT